MLHRNFTVTRPDTPDECFDGAEWSLDDELYAIPKVRARIVQRLCGLDDYGHFTGKMRSSQNPKNWPRWTNRNTPDWADK